MDEENPPTVRRSVRQAARTATMRERDIVDDSVAAEGDLTNVAGTTEQVERDEGGTPADLLTATTDTRATPTVATGTATATAATGTETVTTAQLMGLITNLNNQILMLNRRLEDQAQPAAVPTVAANSPAAPFDSALAVCGLDPELIAKFRGNQGITDLEKLISWKDQQTFREFLLSATRASASMKLDLGGYRMNALVALHLWAQDRSFRQLSLDPTLFTPTVLKESLQELNQDLPLNQSKTAPVKFGPKSEYHNWKSDFVNRLGQTCSHFGKRYNLRYVIRPARAAGDPIPEGFEEIDYDFPLQGKVFKKDNTDVASLLSSELNGHPSIAHIRIALSKKDGRTAMLKLMKSMEGTGPIRNRILEAKERLGRLKYLGNESQYPFAKFTASLVKEFSVLDTDRVYALNERQKLDMFFEKLADIKDNKLTSSVTFARNMCNTLDEAIDSISSEITYNLSTQSSQKNFGNPQTKRKISASQSAKPTQQKSSTSTYDPTKSYTKINGVDISDPTRLFSKEEFSKIGNDGRLYIYKRREHLGHKPKSKKRKVSAAGNQNGVRFGKNATHVFNYKEDDNSDQRNASAYSMIARRQVHASRQSAFDPARIDLPSAGTLGRNELDSHADSCVLGSNFIPLEYTGEYVDVSPFSPEYDSISNIPLVRAATIYTDPETGEERLLVVDQGMYFGKKMPHSLLNPNQIRSHGIRLSDNPFDHVQPFGMADGDNFVPFKTSGTIIFFESRAPSMFEIMNLPQCVLTSDVWDPQNVVLRKEPERKTANVMKVMESRELTLPLTVADNLTDHDCLTDLSPSFNSRLFVSALTNKIGASEEDLNDLNDLNVSRITLNRHTKMDAENLAKTWDVPIATAAKTMKVTTQKGIRTAIHPMNRRYRQLGHLSNTKRVKGHWYADFLHSPVRSLAGNIGGMVYTNGMGFTVLYPTRTANSDDAKKTYDQFVTDVGVPEKLTTDLAAAFVGPHTPFKKAIDKDRVDYTMSEKDRKNQNYAAEMEIGHLRRRYKRSKGNRNFPDRLWDYAMVHEADLLQLFPRGPNERTGFELVHGHTPDISEFADFAFYDLVWYYDGPSKTESSKLGRWLGVSHRVGVELTYWILTEAGKVISSSSVQHVTVDDWTNDERQLKIKEFNENVKKRLDPTNFVVQENIPFGLSIGDTLPPKDDPAYDPAGETPTDED